MPDPTIRSAGPGVALSDEAVVQIAREAVAANYASRGSEIGAAIAADIRGGYNVPLSYLNTLNWAILGARAAAAALSAGAGPVERLKERRKLKFMGDCKCGHCQLVPVELIDEAAARIAALEAENGRLAKERDDAVALADELREPMLKSMRFEDGKLDMEVAGNAVQHMGLLLSEWFRETGAPNYVEMMFHAKSDPFERYVWTIQKAAGLTPHQLRAAAEADRDRLREALAPFAREADEWVDSVSDDERPVIGSLNDGVTWDARFTVRDLRTAKALAPASEDQKGVV